MFLLLLLAFCVLPSQASFLALQVRCKETSLPQIRYVTVVWPVIQGYKSLEVRITAFDGPFLKLLAEEKHDPNSANAVIAYTQYTGEIEVTLLGEEKYGWIQLSFINEVTACREYQQ